MPKLDFNVAFLQDGEVQMKFKVDRTKMKPNGEGKAAPVPVLDAEGFVVQEPVMLGPDILVRIVDAFYESENDLDHAQRLKRGKLARKLADRTPCSLKNYSESDLGLLLELLVKSNASPSIIEQIDSIIHPEDKREEKAA